MVVFGVGRGRAGSTASFLGGAGWYGIAILGGTGYGGMALLFWVVQHGYGGMALLFWVVQHCHFSRYSMVMVEGMEGGWGGA